MTSSYVLWRLPLALHQSWKICGIHSRQSILSGNSITSEFQIHPFSCFTWCLAVDVEQSILKESHNYGREEDPDSAWGRVGGPVGESSSVGNLAWDQKGSWKLGNIFALSSQGKLRRDSGSNGKYKDQTVDAAVTHRSVRCELRVMSLYHRIIKQIIYPPLFENLFPPSLFIFVISLLIEGGHQLMGNVKSS